MSNVMEQTNELRTVSVEKDTWIVELPAELCRREGFAEGTMASFTFKDGAIQASYISPPAKKLRDISQKLLVQDRKLYAELKRIGD